ncbi:MAG: SpoIIE family protein phosphatase [Acidobacteriota bacterium]
MTVRQRWWLGTIFFALMFGHAAVAGYSIRLNWQMLTGSSDGWVANLLPDGRSELATVDSRGPAAGLLQPGDEFISINGVTLKDDPDIRRFNRRVPPGTEYVMTVRRKGELRTFNLKTAPYPLSLWIDPLIDTLVHLLFLLTGLVVFLLKSADRQAWLLALMLGAFTGLFNNDLPPLSLPILLMVALARVTGIVFLPVFTHFFLIFPERSPLLRRYPRLEYWLYLPFFFLLPWFAATRLRTIFQAYEPLVQFIKNSWIFTSRWFGVAALLAAVSYLLSGLVALFLTYRVADTNARRKLNVVVAGSGAGVLNLLALVIWETFFQRRFPQARSVIGPALQFTLPLIPLSFAYAIIRHQVIPVSLIIRRGVRYLLVARGAVLLELLAVSMSVLVVLTYVFSRIRPSGIVIGTVSAAVGIAAWKVSSRLHDKYLAPLIDRQFFRQSYDAQQIMAELTQALRTVTDLPQLLELVATRIQSALQTENVTIFLRDDGTGDFHSAYSCDYNSVNGQAVNCQRSCRLPHYAAFLQQWAEQAEPLEVDLPAAGSEEEQALREAGWSAAELATLREVKTTLLLPLLAKDELLGVLSLGPRLGDLPFSREDKRLLLSVTGPTTFALENARLIDRMLAEARRRQEIEAENEQRAKELEEARQLQLSMLPKKLPQLPGLEIAAYMKTATEVGGDYYDFHLADDGTLTVAVGDATGHGLKAGTVVTAMKSLFRTFAPEPELASVFTRSSRVLKEMNLRSLFMGLTMIKVRSDRVTISSAGMPPVLIYRAAQDEIEEILIKAMPLGSVTGYPYGEHERTVAVGDVIVLMSDGFPERFNDEGEMLDYDRARAALSEVVLRSPREIVEHLVAVGDAWAGTRPQDDDVTFVVLKVKSLAIETTRDIQ